MITKETSGNSLWEISHILNNLMKFPIYNQQVTLKGSRDGFSTFRLSTFSIRNVNQSENNTNKKNKEKKM